MMRAIHCFALAALTVAGTGAVAAAGFTPPPCAQAPFFDVSASDPYCPWIQQFTLDQIGGACGAGNFCPLLPITRAELALHLERAMRGTAAWSPWQGDYFRTVIVTPVDGDPLASGQRLRDAVAGVQPSASEPVLIHLEPGVYDLGNNSLVLAPYTDFEGSGRGTTTVKRGSGGAGSEVIAMVQAIELRHLAVEGASLVSPIEMTGPGARRLHHVTLRSAFAEGLVCATGVIAQLDDVDVEVSAADGGVAAYDGCSLDIEDSSIEVSNGSSVGGAVQVHSGSSRLTRTRVVADGAGSAVWGVFAEGGANVTLDDVTVNVTGSACCSGTDALQLDDSSATVRHSLLRAFGGIANNTIHAIAATGARSVRVSDSRLLIGDVEGSASYTISLATTQLDVSTIDAGGASVTCFAVFDQDFTNANGLTACP